MRNSTLSILLCTAIVVVPTDVIAHEPIALAPGGEIVHGHTYGPAMRYDKVVIRGAQVFNGCDPDLVVADVLISSNLISQIGPDIDPLDGTYEIKADGHTLIPGLIDAHWHGLYAEATILQVMTTNEGYWNLLAARAQRNALYRGFTTVREAAGPMFDVARATDEGIIEGPRIFPSGPAISQTSGHMDFRFTRDVPATPDNLHSFERVDQFISPMACPRSSSACAKT